jgi:peptide methionine sulfoxide reductase msrA/msrB
MRRNIHYYVIGALILSFLLFSVIENIYFDNSANVNSEVDSFSGVDLASLESYETAIFATGCFWCTESDFDKYYGVKEVVSGYAGGEEENPTYKQVSSGETGHVEAVRVYYDPNEISYYELLGIFWRTVDPTDSEGSFVDRGHQYTSAIFYKNDLERGLIDITKAEMEKQGRFDGEIVTWITEETTFYPAEEYHQDYHSKNSLRYNYYRGGSGRDQFLEETWPGEEYVRDESKVEGLDELQYYVTQEEGTERSFDNEYWDNHQSGIYVDHLSGEPLFSSKDKFDSGTGWPSFTRPLDLDSIVKKVDTKLFRDRIEIRSKYGDNHLGHIFRDGLSEFGGIRYCMNSAALEFVPVSEMKDRGYEELLQMFE